MELTIIQQLILGLVQGVAEWLPISSSGMSILVMSNLFGINDLGFLIHSALFLHLGTFLAALIYFHKDVIHLIKSFFNWKKSSREDKNVLRFLMIATIISGIIGLIILKFLSELNIAGKVITFSVGVLLLFTGIIQIKIKNRGLRKEIHIKNQDSIILGVAQGLASLPGISRSGITIGALCIKKFDDTTALRLSFLMSLPIVLLGNIIFNFQDFSIISSTATYGLLASFVFGLLTIHGLMKISKKVNFGYFVLGFAILMILSVLI